jgi:TRAP-type C4-dicarboxylate transport system permease small subunit
MMSSGQNPLPDKVRRVFCAVEDALLVALLLVMILLSSSQILLRIVFETSLVWADSMVRILVLWVGLFGAMVASRKGNHICIDLVTRYFSDPLIRYARFAVDLFTAAICLTVMVHSARLVKLEYLDGALAFAWVPAWVCMGIIPFSFFVMGLRYLILAFVSLRPERSPK